MQQPVPSPPSDCPVLHCPWQQAEDTLDEHLYDAHSARQLASTLANLTAAFEVQATLASGLLNDLDAARGTQEG